MPYKELQPEQWTHWVVSCGAQGTGATWPEVLKELISRPCLSESEDQGKDPRSDADEADW
jgi:hypothetical protein